MGFVVLNKNVATRKTVLRNFLLVLCFHLWQKGLSTVVFKIQVERHSTFKY